MNLKPDDNVAPLSFNSIAINTFGILLLICRLVTSVVDVGSPADWVKINVRQTVCSYNLSSFSSISSYIHAQKN